MDLKSYTVKKVIGAPLLALVFLTLTGCSETQVTGTLNPQVAGISPISGSNVGGTLVTITGVGFSMPIAVTIGGVACAPITLVSSTSITCLTPPLLTAVTPASGNLSEDVNIVQNGTSIATLTGGFTYNMNAMALTSYSPSSCSLTDNGGVYCPFFVITAGGSNFSSNATVTLTGNTPGLATYTCTPSSITPTLLVATCSTSNAALGRYTLSINNPSSAPITEQIAAVP